VDDFGTEKLGGYSEEAAAVIEGADSVTELSEHSCAFQPLLFDKLRFHISECLTELVEATADKFQ
jgi:hypothetical protein